MSNDLSIDERLTIFHSLDFEGFNKQDWPHFSSIHTDDVIVEVGGVRTEGIDSHVDETKKIFTQAPDTHIEEYLIAFGSGDWTCTVSRVTNMGKPESQVVTIAKWRGAQVSEEYIYFA